MGSLLLAVRQSQLVLASVGGRSALVGFGRCIRGLLKPWRMQLSVAWNPSRVTKLLICIAVLDSSQDSWPIVEFESVVLRYRVRQLRWRDAMCRAAVSPLAAWSECYLGWRLKPTLWCWIRHARVLGKLSSRLWLGLRLGRSLMSPVTRPPWLAICTCSTSTGICLDQSVLLTSSR